MKTFRILLLFLVVATIVVGSVQQTSLAPASAKTVTAANDFLATLSPAEKAKVSFPFNSPQRTGWSNLPSGIFQRNGLRLGDLTPTQRKAALALVASALSRDGYQKVTEI